MTAEAIGIIGRSRSYSGTLAERTGKRTVMYVAIKEAGGETLTDDRNGNLVGNQGSTGTINYATGAYSVITTAGAVTADYYWEDATSDGPLDFDTSSPGAGKAKIFRQDDGGAFMAVLPFLDVEYAFHLLKTWAVTTTIDDTSRDQPALPRHRHPVPEGREGDAGRHPVHRRVEPERSRKCAGWRSGRTPTTSPSCRRASSTR